jgi:hypothetical protein
VLPAEAREPEFRRTPDMKLEKIHSAAVCIAAAAAAVLLASGASTGVAATKKQLDLNDPADRFLINRKRGCSLVDGRPVIFWWQGNMYSRVPGEKDRVLFKVHGMNIRQCASVPNDPIRGRGYASVSREVMFYIDPKTDQVASRWFNPWLKREVDVVQVANDPPGGPFTTWEKNEKGEYPNTADRWIVKDGLVMHGGGAARLFYKNPLAGEYQQYVGGDYHSMEFGSSSTPLSQVLDPKTTEVEDHVHSWARISKWLPWMEMGDREGVVVFHTTGVRVKNFDEMPDIVKNEIRKNFPIYAEPPPIDYKKPRQTSWTVFKDYIDAKRAKEAAPKAGTAQ